jgi:hypothetical protein
VSGCVLKRHAIDRANKIKLLKSSDCLSKDAERAVGQLFEMYSAVQPTNSLDFGDFQKVMQLGFSEHWSLKDHNSLIEDNTFCASD